MPPGVGVVDAFKSDIQSLSLQRSRNKHSDLFLFLDLIRHGKHHNHAPRTNVAKSHDDHNAQPAQAHSRAQRQQGQAQAQAVQANPVAHANNQQPSQPMKSPPPREIAQSLVNEEREAKTKMPTYKGLENFKLLEKMGESVVFGSLSGDQF